MTAVEDEPGSDEVTDAGRAAGQPPVTLTPRKAAERGGWSLSHVTRLCRQGRIRAVQVDRHWLLDWASLDAYRSPAPRPPLQAEPLLRLIEMRGGPRAVGVRPQSAEEKALERAARTGRVTLRVADQLAVRLLGLTPWEVWGTAYDAAWA